MIRLLIWLALALLLAGAGWWLAMHPGSVVLDWQGWHVEAPAFLLFLAALLLFVAGLVAMRLGLYLWREFPLSPAARRIRSERRGREALKRALEALAADDARRALDQAERGVRLLGAQDRALAHLVAAQAARRLGEDERAEGHLKVLSGDPALSLVGLRARFEEAVAAGRREEALELARAAEARAPKSPWAVNALFDALVALDRFEEAAGMLDRLRRLGALDEEALARRTAALAMARAEAAEAAGDDDAARRLAEEALAARADFVPAAALLVRLFHRAGRERAAMKRLRAVLERNPHPLLAELARSLVADRPAASRRKALEDLLAPVRDHPEARLALAEAALAAGDPKAARELLVGVGEERDRRFLEIRARLARAEGDEAAAERWRIRARELGVMPGWICTACGARSDRWRVRCPHCGAFDTLEWGLPASPMALAPGEGRTGALVAPEKGEDERAVAAPPPSD